MNPRKQTTICPPQAVAIPSRFILLPIRVFTAMCLLLGLLFATRSHAQQNLVAKSSFPATTAPGTAPASKNSVTLKESSSSAYTIYPSTVKKSASVTIEAARDEWATLRILDMGGEIVLEQQMAVSKGTNKVPVFFISGLEKGKYATMLLLEDKLYFAPIVKE